MDLRPRAMDEPTESLAGSAYRVIEELIVTQRLRPGSMISEKQLAEQLGCGRTPVREALQRLQFEGYVEIHPRRGVLVSPIDVVKQLELLEVRGPMENLVVRLAASRATAEERAGMRHLADEIRAAARAADAVSYLSAIRAIHEAEARATHNSMLAATIGVIHGQSRRFWYARTGAKGGFYEGAEIHATMLTAIADGDAERATASAGHLLEHLERMTRSALER